MVTILSKPPCTKYLHSSVSGCGQNSKHITANFKLTFTLSLKVASLKIGQHIHTHTRQDKIRQDKEMQDYDTDSLPFIKFVDVNVSTHIAIRYSEPLAITAESYHPDRLITTHCLLENDDLRLIMTPNTNEATKATSG
jgi:hypothetical protein